MTKTSFRLSPSTKRFVAVSLVATGAFLSGVSFTSIFFNNLIESAREDRDNCHALATLQNTEINTLRLALQELRESLEAQRDILKRNCLLGNCTPKDLEKFSL